MICSVCRHARNHFQPRFSCVGALHANSGGSLRRLAAAVGMSSWIRESMDMPAWYTVCVRATGITCTFSAGLVTIAVVSQRKTSACEEQQNVEWKLATSFYMNNLGFFGWALFLEKETLALCLQPSVIIRIFVSIYMLIMLFFRPSKCLRGMKTEQSYFEVLPLAWKSFSQVWVPFVTSQTGRFIKSSASKRPKMWAFLSRVSSQRKSINQTLFK